MKKRLLLGCAYSVIEPLGLLHLGGLARDLGWERSYCLVKDHDFTTLFDQVKDYKPDIIGFNVYTGNHIQLGRALRKIRSVYPNIILVVGGPHATYFPVESNQFADFVVMSEGFDSFRKILLGEAKPGILFSNQTVRFPHPDRITFYAQYPEHAQSFIKSIITMTGCPYTCTYCYNSSTPADIDVTPELAHQLAESMGKSGRLFPQNIRLVGDVIKEGIEIVENWSTKLLYCQDDVHGFDLKRWMPEFARRWPIEVGLPYHAQMRWEMTKDVRRLDLLKAAGCNGLTLAIEAANPIIRKEVLSRGMPEELMFKGMQAVVNRGFRVRTEQITGLPYGATTEETPMNLDADLELVELNVRLKVETGGPTMAWASTLAPYRGTKLGAYCGKYGHYEGDNSDVPDTFFEKSVLNFPKEWVGPGLEKHKHEPEVWLDQAQNDRYGSQNAELRRIFQFVTLVPDGHKLAKKYLNRNGPFSYFSLGKDIENHLYLMVRENSIARAMFGKIPRIRSQIHAHPTSIKHDLANLAAFFTAIPNHIEAIKRVIKYSEDRNQTNLEPQTFSDAIRHHLYEKVLYA